MLYILVLSLVLALALDFNAAVLALAWLWTYGCGLECPGFGLGLVPRGFVSCVQVAELCLSSSDSTADS